MAGLTLLDRVATSTPGSLHSSHSGSRRRSPYGRAGSPRRSRAGAPSRRNECVRASGSAAGSTSAGWSRSAARGAPDARRRRSRGLVLRRPSMAPADTRRGTRGGTSGQAWRNATDPLSPPVNAGGPIPSGLSSVRGNARSIRSVTLVFEVRRFPARDAGDAWARHYSSDVSSSSRRSTLGSACAWSRGSNALLGDLLLVRGTGRDPGEDAGSRPVGARWQSGSAGVGFRRWLFACVVVRAGRPGVAASWPDRRSASRGSRVR